MEAIKLLLTILKLLGALSGPEKGLWELCDPGQCGDGLACTEGFCAPEGGCEWHFDDFAECEGVEDCVENEPWNEVCPTGPQGFTASCMATTFGYDENGVTSGTCQILSNDQECPEGFVLKEGSRGLVYTPSTCVAP